MNKYFNYRNNSIEFSFKDDIFELKGHLFLSETDTQKILSFLNEYIPEPNVEMDFFFIPTLN